MDWLFFVKVIFVALVVTFSLSQLFKEYFKWKVTFVGGLLFDLLNEAPKILLKAESKISEKEVSNHEEV